MNTNDEIFISNFEDFGIIDEESIEEMLDEICVYKNEKDNISITVDGDGETDYGFSEDPYFKVYPSKRPGKGEPIRVAFKDGKARYIIHNGNNKVFNSRERKKIESYMNKRSTNYPDITVWESIKKTTCSFITNKELIKDTMNYEKPDFLNDLK